MVGAVILSRDLRAFLDAARTATLATVDLRGRPRLVPVCFALRPEDAGAASPVLYTPLDAKPKTVSDVHELARARDIRVRPDVTLLVDRWDEDWSRLSWLRLHGRAELMEPGTVDADEHAAAIGLLRGRYPQYGAHALEALPIIRIRIERAVAWNADQGAVLPNGR